MRTIHKKVTFFGFKWDWVGFDWMNGLDPT